MKSNYKIENYTKCENCKHFAQHYNIEYDYIHKVNCGHCYKSDKDINPRRITCPYFEQRKNNLSKTSKPYIINLLQELNLKLEYIKLYLNKNKPKQELSDTMINKLNK